MRMRAHRAIDAGESFGDRQDVAVASHARRDGHDPPDAGSLGTRHHAVELGGEVGKIEVAVAVNQHDRRPEDTKTVRRGGTGEPALGAALGAARPTRLLGVPGSAATVKRESARSSPPSLHLVISVSSGTLHCVDVPKSLARRTSEGCNETPAP